MVKSECGIAFAVVAVFMMGITSTQAEAPLTGYGRDSYDSRGGYRSSSPGYVYGPPKETGIPGIPGRDYPNFSEAPPTSFSCERQPLPGYYADPETGCQVYHVCEKGVQEREPRLCPIGSIFDQEKLTCAWWYEVDCARSAAAAPAVNSAVVAAMEEADALARARKYGKYGPPSGAYGAPITSYGPPSGAYGAPSAAFGAAAGSFSGGSGSYNSRSGPFNSLLRAYGAPSRGLGGAFGGFRGSSRGSGSLSGAYGAPSLGVFGGAAPSGAYGAPSAGLFQSGAPSEEYGAPGGGQGGRSYLPPSF